MRQFLGRFARGAALTVAAAFLGSGCVAFNVGEPETFTNRERIVETATTPLRTEILSANAQVQTSGAEAAVRLGLDLQDEFEKREHVETATIRKQKRLAIGLFPGAAESFLMPDGALAVTGAMPLANPQKPGEYIFFGDPRDNTYDSIGGQVVGTLMGYPVVIGTFYSLLCAPFDDWTCRFHSYFDPQFVTKCPHNPLYWETSGSPKLKALRKMPPHVRSGVNTCYEFQKHSGGPLHLGLVGCHKYLAVFVDGPIVGPSTVVGTETKRRNAFATGPFIAEFAIPALNHNDWKRVAAGGSQAAFALPAVERDCTVEAVVSFREDNTVNGRNAGDLTRQALAKAAGRQWRFDVALKGTGRTQPPPPPSTPPEKLYDGITITPMDEGKYLVKVTVRDTSKTFTVLHLIKAEVQRLAREDFRSRHPGEPAEFIRESIRYETEEGGKILAFTGWVFSVRPAEDGWRYDDESRRGWIRLRVTGGIPAAEAEKWAHENIGEIVKYKNVALEEGRAPPPGATFRSLSERFENGVLSVEFEAVE